MKEELRDKHIRLIHKLKGAALANEDAEDRKDIINWSREKLENLDTYAISEGLTKREMMQANIYWAAAIKTPTV